MPSRIVLFFILRSNLCLLFLFFFFLFVINRYVEEVATPSSKRDPPYDCLDVIAQDYRPEERYADRGRKGDKETRVIGFTRG